MQAAEFLANFQDPIFMKKAILSGRLHQLSDINGVHVVLYLFQLGYYDLVDLLISYDYVFDLEANLEVVNLDSLRSALNILGTQYNPGRFSLRYRDSLYRPLALVKVMKMTLVEQNYYLDMVISKGLVINLDNDNDIVTVSIRAYMMGSQYYSIIDLAAARYRGADDVQSVIKSAAEVEILRRIQNRLRYNFNRQSAALHLINVTSPGDLRDYVINSVDTEVWLELIDTGDLSLGEITDLALHHDLSISDHPRKLELGELYRMRNESTA